MSSNGTVHLPSSTITGKRPPYRIPNTLLWGHNSIPRYHYVSSVRPGRLIIDVVFEIEADKQNIKQDHAQQQATLADRLDQEILAQAGPLDGLSTVEALSRQLDASQRLIQQRQAELATARQQADSFFGSDPEHKSFQQFLTVATRPSGHPNPKQAWLASYKAAFEAKVLDAAIAHLSRRMYSLKSAHNEAFWQQRRHDSLSRSLHSAERGLNWMLTDRHQYDQAKSALQTLVENFQRHHLEDIDPAAAALHAIELERETSDLIKARNALNKSQLNTNLRFHYLTSRHSSLAFDLNFDQRRAPRPLHQQVQQLHSQIGQYLNEHQQSWAAESATVAELMASAHQNINAAFEEQTRLAALAGQPATQTPTVFNAWTASTSHPLVLAASQGAMTTFEAVLSAFETGLKNAAKARFEAALGRRGLFVTLMTYSTRLGNGERMGISVPLAHLSPGADLEQEAGNRIGQTTALPLRLGVNTVGEFTQIYMATTDGNDIPGDVRVRRAHWDAAKGAYSFTSDGVGATTILWHPITPPSSLPTFDPETGNAIPPKPIEEDLQKHYPGTIHVPTVPTVSPLPGLADAHFDDYIIVFPADSGLAPVYIMLKDAREYAGVATGYGQVPGEGWAHAVSTPDGAPIPSQIAEKLRGRTFATFRKLREAFWMAVAADPVLNKYFTLTNLEFMKEGNAPYATSTEQVGGSMKLQLHHIHHIANGGAVYDLDNLTILTPRQHIDLHNRRP
ncbi:S-type pyocin domain-containing protein [Pseudomonas rubra]|uniref:S-type pyocin domain-containing protein n=1 Tax=Pseudomonas rubra TaxID=2942627 RepID=A0ABT5PEC2_9PSED|nr:S-type pyocin domain-containing protein [Pseudomonas rubra]MDD1016294.1 S-type pyocin domain-containing protein [Pseudomonas rubra]MDD1041355.1 S-type pyocin domain-containing protein [Pseudomonas rubra]MDD1153338.1 S-type pyocin domain-containing protein [Pseudomonas rubra]